MRALSECLLADEDWDRAGCLYAMRRDEHFGAVHRVTTWLSELLYEVGPEAPSNERARRRMFGED